MGSLWSSGTHFVTALETQPVLPTALTSLQLFLLLQHLLPLPLPHPLPDPTDPSDLTQTHPPQPCRPL